MGARLNFVFICLFGLILVMPLALTLTDTALTTPLKENRLRQPFPDLAACDMAALDECHGQLDSWFNDNYRPRDLLTKLKTQIDFSVFSTSDKVHIGPDNWLLYRTTMDSQKVVVERAEQSRFDALLEGFDDLDQYLKKRNIQLIVLPIPLKNVIYPEFTPRSVPNLPQDSRYQKLRKWLAGHDSILTIDAYEFLLARKKDARAYHKTDFHWNDPAGFLFAEKLVNLLWQFQTGLSTPLWDEPLTIEERTYSGAQASFLPLLSPPGEMGLFLAASREPGKGTHDFNPPGNVWSYTYDGSAEPRGKLDGVVVMGDSYFDAMQRSGIDSYFASVHRAPIKNDRFSDIYANIPPGTRYLIFEFIEVSLVEMLYQGLSVPGSGSENE